ncbi:MAG: class II glutamine amidotransferase [Pirellulales bacterium]|nr:class II glutamine amidotransferase [Pirellulales bacterium]
MCRWLAYSGGEIFLEDILFAAKQNLIDQSLSSRSAETPTNGDGFGVGWYGKREQPGLFRSIRPAWNDFNLRDLAANIESRLFLAHVRATSLTTVQETNCHPFRYGNWLFVHNGEIFEVERLRRDLLMSVAPQFFSNILGTTDSEVMFHLALSFGLSDDPPAALARMAGFIEHVGRAYGVTESLWMTVGVTDGETLYGVRYASDGDAPTLFYSPDIEHLYRLNPAITGRFGAVARAVVSEPIGEFSHLWREVPQSSLLVVRGGEIEVRSFRPTPVNT